MWRHASPSSSSEEEKEDIRPVRITRQTSQTSQASQASQASQTSQISLRSHQSHTGLSQGLENVAITNLTPPASPSARVIDTRIPALSYGVVCLAERASNNRRQKTIEPFALQNTFYAYPIDADQDVLQTINEKITDVSADFELQGYTIEKKVFPLPFAVKQICRVSLGYTMTAKKLKAPSSKKRKSSVDKDSSEDSDGASESEPSEKGK